ncbi:MAG TPA: hypothetical protein VMT32_09870 [Bryobacteraceae bacterium]|nr:hypothetical protein [Bryobacteraceae bacterium]
MFASTADAVATLHIPNIPAICMHAADNDYMKREIEKWLAHHVVLLSENRPESGILSPISVTAQRWPSPSKFYADELLDWDAAIEVAPMRPSGTLMVTLKYAGRATPSPVMDPWD